ncbi:galactoside 2-alpha-L-fucosyltransferase Sec1-like [Euwallacea similis]|uniref:galactoside 2-alpha-L-fucosyltransferase Sec1-like n=1 Tax=Euwallacea similis TaxID=1736056 RepID=UPI00344E580B
MITQLQELAWTHSDLKASENYTELTIKESKMRLNVSSYRDLNDYLCVWVPQVSKEKTNTSVEKKRCPRKGIVSFMVGGRIGNQIWEYATLWSIAYKTGLQPFLPGCVKRELSELFDKLSISTLDSIAHCPFNLNNTVDNMNHWISIKQSIITPQFIFHLPIVLPNLDYLINREFVLKEKLRDKAQRLLIHAIQMLPALEYTFVGVHVRRTDYIKYLQKVYNSIPAFPSFFYRAMDFFKNNYQNCLFVYVSDDPQWCFNEFGGLNDVVVISYQRNNTPAEDMAIMAACNHTIFDYGTFGEWGALLAGGDTVFKRMKRNIDRPTRSLENWFLLD